jgi:GMP synthase (glutamine-hydrolysing)
MHQKVLLLQARYPDDPAKKEELDSFAEKLGMLPEQVRSYDLLEGPPTLDHVLEHDAVMMGGSGEFYVSKGNLPGFHELLDLLKLVTEVGHPMFASCFGFQCLVEALGGRIIHDPENTEVGTYEVELTKSGKHDPLLSSLPNRFPAQLGRKDRAERLPDGVPNLASSKASPYQAFRIPGKPIWAFQFHPELNRAENRLRFDRYMNGYAVHMSPEERLQACERFTESPETETLLQRFLEVVFD